MLGLGRKQNSRLRQHIRSNVVGYVALVVALSMAPAWASHLNVKTSDINKGAVTTPKLRNQAVGPAKIKGGAVKRGKLAPVLRPRWAYVALGTELRAERGVVNVRMSGDFGRVVEFDRYDFGECAAVATPVGGFQARGATVNSSGENEILVNLHDASGSLVGGHFQLLVFC